MRRCGSRKEGGEKRLFLRNRKTGGKSERLKPDLTSASWTESGKIEGVDDHHYGEKRFPRT